MKEPISILAVGVSCPGGTGPAALEADWPSRRVSQITNPDITREVATIDLTAEPFNRWRMRPRLRRASPLSHHLIEAVAQILESHPDINPAVRSVGERADEGAFGHHVAGTEKEGCSQRLEHLAAARACIRVCDPNTGSSSRYEGQKVAIRRTSHLQRFMSH